MDLLFFFRRRSAPPAPLTKTGILRREIAAIERKMHKVELQMDKLEAQFWKNGGVCCPTCGLPGYSDLEWAQERREAWLKILRAKLVQRIHTNNPPEP
jgi:hypothetical protein